MVTFPANPNLLEVPNIRDLGNIRQAARAAGVKPDTIRIWVRRGKVAPFLRTPGQPDLFHLPTVRAAAEAGAKHRAKTPVALALLGHRAA